jgi:glycosyltransferase involved in cell wall biosynthesis
VRVLYLNPCGQMGGAETSLRELLASVRAAKPEWELWLTLGEDGPLAAKARSLGVRVIVAPFPPQLLRLGEMGRGQLATLCSLPGAAVGIILYARRLKAIVRAVRPDIIHTNGFKMHLLGAWTGWPQRPVVWHIHDYVRTRPLVSNLLRRSAQRCAAVVVNSKSVAAEVRALLPGVAVVPIYNAIDLKRFAPAGRVLDLDAISGLPPADVGVVRVGLVGTFARWKGHKVFLQALSRLAPDTPVRGYVIGGPIYQTSGSQWSKEELRQEADRLGLSGRVGFTGFLDDCAAAMRSLDIIVHASTAPEPFGMVIAEGMACEKAVIACRAGGASELFTEEENALGHPPGDVIALATQIARLAADEPLRRRLGKSGRATAEKLYYGQRLARELLAVYEGLAGAPVCPEPEFAIGSSNCP